MFVLKVATGSLDGGKGFATNMASIVSEHGWKGLYGKSANLQRAFPGREPIRKGQPFEPLLSIATAWSMVHTIFNKTTGRV